GFTLKTPKRRSSMRWPRPRACFNDSKTVSTACSALVRLMFVLATTAFTISSLITRSSRASEPDARGCGAGCQGRGASSTLNIFWRSRSNHFGVATDRRDRSKVILGGMDGRQARPMDPAHVAGAQDDRAVYGPAGARRSDQLRSVFLRLRHPRGGGVPHFHKCEHHYRRSKTFRSAVARGIQW